MVEEEEGKEGNAPSSFEEATSIVSAKPVLEEEDYDYGGDDDDDDDDDGGGGEEGEKEARGAAQGNEDDGDEDEDECAVSFKGDVNPLDFVNDNASGAKLYRLLEMDELQYDAFAEKKRKTTADNYNQASAKRFRREETEGATFAEIMEAMNYGMPRRSRKHKKRGRKKGSRKKLSPEIGRKLANATLKCALGSHEEAVSLLQEVIKLDPNLFEPYHTLGIAYQAMGEQKKALVCYLLAAFLSPKDSYIWKRLWELSKEQGDSGLECYVLQKAIRADPGDVTLMERRAYIDENIKKEDEKAAESYLKIVQLFPDNVEALKKATQLYRKVGKQNISINILEDYLNDHPPGNDFKVVDVLVALCMETTLYKKALELIKRTKNLCPREELPFNLIVKEGICYANLGDVDQAQICLSCLKQQDPDIAEGMNMGELYSAIAQCYLDLRNRDKAITFLYEALRAREENVDARLTVASILLEEKREDEAISLLSPPTISGPTTCTKTEQFQPWWSDGKIKLALSHIYVKKSMLEAFVDTIFHEVYDSIKIASMKQEAQPKKKKLSNRVLNERVKNLDDSHGHSFGFRAPASKSDTLKANRAKRSLEKNEAVKEEKRLAALAAGLPWESDESDDDDQIQQEGDHPSPPLPNLLDENYWVVKNLCSSLISLRRYGEALQIINLAMKLKTKVFDAAKKEELRSLGAQIALCVTDPSDAFDFIRHLIQKHSRSITAWNCYYKLALRLENRFSKHSKLLLTMRNEHEDLVPPMLITGNQLTMISQHQAAAARYLEAYKLMPESSLINICAGTALVNLALGHRLHNKHQCLAQGLAFLYNNLRLCGETQEAMYNIARAYHHVGLVSLAASYYDMVIATPQKDYPMPKLSDDHMVNPEPGYCNLRREAAYNLHLIYKASGAVDLARQVLKDYCTL